MKTTRESVTAEMLALVETMAEQQHSKLLTLARASVPHLTEDDLKNPDDFPSLHHDARFNYEDGVLSGLRMAGAAIRASFMDRPGID